MEGSAMQSNCSVFTQEKASSILPHILIIEILLGLPGNVIALYIFCRHLQSWRPNIVFLFNLILADFLLLLSMPFRIDTHLRAEEWVFGDAWCRINLFMLAVNRSASIGFMTTVAVDRYFKVVHPHNKVNFMSSRQAGGIACLIWTVVISLRLPLLTNNLLSAEENVSFCRSFRPHEDSLPGIWLHHIVYILEFFLCLMILLFCSFRIYCILHNRKMDKNKRMRQAIRIVLVIVVVFIVCFGPGVAIGLAALYLKSLGNEYCDAYKLTGQMFVVALAFTYLNSVLDPLIYGFSSSLFRDALKSSFSHLGVSLRSCSTTEGDH